MPVLGFVFVVMSDMDADRILQAHFVFEQVIVLVLVLGRVYDAEALSAAFEKHYR
jgi:hypothetical protein